jgi:hypothetical protein
MKQKNKFLGAIAFLFLGTTSFAQVSTPTNISPPGAPFVGWNGTGVPRDLEIRNDFNRPITMYTNGIGSFVTYVVQNCKNTPPKTSALAH